MRAKLSLNEAWRLNSGMQIRTDEKADLKRLDKALQAGASEIGEGSENPFRPDGYGKPLETSKETI